MQLKKAFYVRAQSRGHNATLQRRLIDLGVRWGSGYRVKIRHRDAKYLYVTKSGRFQPCYELINHANAVEINTVDLYTQQMLVKLGFNGKV
jgi:hypothetical protein